MKQASKPLPNGKHTVTPYLMVKGAARFIDFLKEAFDAHEFGRAENPDGTIGHAEVQVGDSTLMIVDPKEMAVMIEMQKTFEREMDKYLRAVPTS